MRVPTSFTTQRLQAERITEQDESFLTAMFADPRVNATLGGPRDAVGVRAMLDRWTAHWDRCGFGTWILTPRPLPERPGAAGAESAASGRIGWVGLQETDVGGPGGVELLYAIAADHWRRGFATEAGRVVVEIGHRDLDRDELVCFTMVTNAGSRAVMEGLGFLYDRDVEHAGLPHALYRRKASDG